MYKLLKRFTKPIGFEANVLNEDEVKVKIVNCPEFCPFYLIDYHRKDINFQYKEITRLDFARHSICVRTDVYPLAFLFWNFIYKAELLNHNLQCKVFSLLKNRFNNGEDFVPSCQFIGGWKSMIKHFVAYKTNKHYAKRGY